MFQDLNINILIMPIFSKYIADLYDNKNPQWIFLGPCKFFAQK